MSKLSEEYLEGVVEVCEDPEPEHRKWEGFDLFGNSIPEVGQMAKELLLARAIIKEVERIEAGTYGNEAGIRKALYAYREGMK